MVLGVWAAIEALPAVSGGPVLQLLPPGHADGPSSASPGEVVVGQLEKVVQHGADGVVLVAVPLVAREPQPQLLGRHVAAAADSDVAELFPLMASLPTGSPPQRRPLKQRRTHCELEQAWDCILRKLPMPFEHFCGAEAWEMPTVWEQHCYDSVLAGKAVSAEDHRLAVNTANVMGWETFREFHDCYLHTDVLALADVMESYRDPIHYVTLPGAAWDAMLRHSARETPIHLITDEQAYKDVRASVMGGLSCIFQPFAQANNRAGRGGLPKEPSGMLPVTGPSNMFS